MRKGVRAAPGEPHRALAQVHRKEERSARSQIAAIIRHTGNIPELSERRNALRFLPYDCSLSLPKVITP
jgi:hypothetical protein